MRVDPAKVRAIAGPRTVSKQVPSTPVRHLTKPLRELTQNDVDWTCGTAQESALDALKKAVKTTPVLRYCNLKEEVTLQCDASQFVLGAALLQHGQSVA